MQILRTPRLILRWMRRSDARYILRQLNDPGWLRNIGQRHVHDIPAAREWIQTRLVSSYGRQGFGFWAMERIEDRRVIGMCGLIARDTLPHPDVGYALLPRYRGQGYTREAAAACLAYARDVLGLEEVWGITSPTNEASARVLSGIGMDDLGIRHFEGDWGDSRVFSWKLPGADALDDRARIDALVARFFRAFRHVGDDIPTLPALPHYFLPRALVSSTGVDGRLATTEVHGFIAPRAELFARGRLTDFDEWEVDHRTEITGDIAQRWLRYAKRGVMDGRPFEGRGTKAMQLVKTPQGWKIAALAWQDLDPATVAAAAAAPRPRATPVRTPHPPHAGAHAPTPVPPAPHPPAPLRLVPGGKA